MEQRVEWECRRWESRVEGGPREQGADRGGTLRGKSMPWEGERDHRDEVWS